MSTSQKRDADMDRLLRAVLRPAPEERAGDCPDANVLAAFVEGALSATEQSALDAHSANCGRCQEALALLSHDLPHTEADAAAPESGWFTRVTRPRLRWLVPISAAATVAVVFLATRPLIAPEGEAPGTEVARMAQAPAPRAELPGAGAGAPHEQSAAVPQKGQPAGPPERRETARALADIPPPTLIGQAAPDKKALAEAVADQVPAERAAADEQRTRAVAEPVAPQIATAPTAASAPTKGAAAAKIPAADAMGAMPATAQMREEMRRLEPVATVMAAPDGKVRWRLGPGGRIWQSTDAGSTWHWQPADVSADLVAGSAPSATTCWAVGSGGVVLLTVDGQRWTLLPFPLRVDLAAVHATNDRIATVTTRDGRRFETLDAGRNWSPRQ